MAQMILITVFQVLDFVCRICPYTFTSHFKKGFSVVLKLRLCFSWMYGESTDREVNYGRAVVLGFEEVAEAGIGLDRRWNRLVLNWGEGQR